MLHDIEIDKSKFDQVRGIISGKYFLEGLENDLFISHEVYHMFITKQNFEKYTEVDESYRRVTKFSCPNDEKWDNFLELLE